MNRNRKRVFFPAVFRGRIILPAMRAGGAAIRVSKPGCNLPRAIWRPGSARRPISKLPLPRQAPACDELRQSHDCLCRKTVLSSRPVISPCGRIETRFLAHFPRCGDRGGLRAHGDFVSEIARFAGSTGQSPHTVAGFQLCDVCELSLVPSRQLRELARFVPSNDDSSSNGQNHSRRCRWA